MMLEQSLLTIIIFMPLVGAMVLMALAPGNIAMIKRVAVGVGVCLFGASVVMVAGFDGARAGEMQFGVQTMWFHLWGGAITYHLGVDGLSMPLVVLTSLLMLVSLVYSAATIQHRVKEYFIFFLLLAVGVLGTFCALDLFLFYVFWELTMMPMYFLIGIWGGPRRQYAAVKFFVYTSIGSLLMLLAIIYLYYHSGALPGAISPIALTADLTELMLRQGDGLVLPGMAGALCFWAFYAAFAVKVPAFPLHTWLPDAHVEAPTAGSVMLAGVLLKMGTYGLMRVNLGLFPAESHQYATVLMLIGLIGLIYGSLCALAQTDMKKLIAYSSVGHMGFVMLGIGAAAQTTMPEGSAPWIAEQARVMALNGAALQMVNHGLITGALFLLVGVVYERAHHRDLRKLGGLLAVMPVYGGLLIFMAMASLGLPGLAGFWGEFFALAGAFQMHPVLGGLAVIGVVLAAAYLLLIVQRVLMGPVRDESHTAFRDVGRMEKWCLYPLAALVLLFGLWPKPLLEPINQVSVGIVRNYLPAAPLEPPTTGGVARR